MALVGDQSADANSQQSLSMEQIIDTVSKLYELSSKANESLSQHILENKNDNTGNSSGINGVNDINGNKVNDVGQNIEEDGHSDSNFLAFLARCGGGGTVPNGGVSLGKKKNGSSTSTTNNNNSTSTSTTNNNNSTSTSTTNNNNSTSSKNDKTSDKSKKRDDQSQQHLNSGTSLAQLQKLSFSLSFMVNALTELKKLEDALGKPIQTLDSKLRSILESKLTVDQMKPMLQKINKEITSLKGQIPYPLKIASKDDDSPQELQVSNWLNSSNAVHKLPNLHLNERFSTSSEYTSLEAAFESLKARSKNCLLCFGVFPENALVKKRVLVYWWIGEGLLDPVEEEKRPEEIAEQVLRELMEKGFIEPVYRKRGGDANLFKMQPFVRSAVIELANKYNFFDYDSEGNPTANFSTCLRACLVKTDKESSWLETLTNPTMDQEKAPESGNGGESWSRAGQGSSRNRVKNNHKMDQERLLTLFNVNEPFPDIPSDWLSKLRYINVFSLGKWSSIAEDHIEVESTDFLKELRNMKHLRFLGLQGIYTIDQVPDTICKLINLRVLDLRACYSLVTLPKEIGSLINLTHLDLSECYLLDHMPKGISKLSELQVLKGFVITESERKDPCTLADLSGLDKLWYLSININKEYSSLKKEIVALQNFKKLLKLTITWGGGKDPKRQNNNTPNATAENQEKTAGGKNKEDGKAKLAKTLTMGVMRLSTFRRPDRLDRLPQQLETLDIQCFPEATPPTWLMPQNLEGLKKLCIRGGLLTGLGKTEYGSKVESLETLILKHLCHFKMEWREMKRLFPNMKYLEKVQCSHVTFCPCDDEGVWFKS